MKTVRNGSPWRRLSVVCAVALGVLLGAGAAQAQQVTKVSGPWSMLDRTPPAEVLTDPWVRPLRGQAAHLDVQAMQGLLAQAPFENTPQAIAPLVVTLPDPEGNWQRFNLVEYSVMEAPLAAAHPEIKTYRGEGVDDQWATIRCSLTPLGFQAQVRTPGETGPTSGMWHIDAYTRGNTALHMSYRHADAGSQERSFTCHTVGGAAEQMIPFRSRSASGPTLRTYRLAMAVTGETTVWAGGPAAALTLVTNITNQLNGIYETDLTVRFVLVAGEASIIYPSAASDPFTSVTSAGTTNGQLQTTLDTTIGDANYDVGHVIHYNLASNNGLAGDIGSVCRAGIKGEGYSAYGNPNDAYFVIDYVSHELGHQFGGRHTQSNCAGSAGDGAAYTVEAGSGTTIMSYAGICGGPPNTNVQAHNDPYFNGLNIDQINTYLNTQACAATSATGNTAPTITPLTAYAIPTKTPFVLTASAIDPDGDPLTYCWEQQDGATAGPVGTDNGTNPIDRSRSAVTSPSRMIPRLSTLLANTTDQWELIPQVARPSMDWRVTVRDNRSGGGGVNQATVALNVVNTGPFRVSFPGGGESLLVTGSPTTVMWDIGGTNVSPISVSSVKISLSTDGGNTFPTVLAASVPNTGSASVVLPATSSTTARVKIEAIGNIFFDISDTNFTMATPAPGVQFVAAGPATIFDTGGNGNANGRIDSGENGIGVLVPISNTGATTATSVVGTLVSNTPTVSVVSAVSAYPDLSTAATASNTMAFTLNVQPGHVCGDPINLTLLVSSAQGSGVGGGSIPVTLSTGLITPQVPTTFTYSGAAVSIPDNSTTGINVNLPVSGLAGTISDLNFRFNGSSCSTSTTSTTVGLTHSSVGQLVAKLTSPQGTTVTIITRPGGTGTGTNTGNNFCNTILDDDGAFTSILNIASGSAPFTASYLPANPLSAFDGEDPNGIWVLNVADVVLATTGTVRTFSLVITPFNPPSCTPPLVTNGACCAVSGACTVVAQAACSGSSVYQGDGTACVPSPCPPAYGACCAPGGNCLIATQTQCANQGNTYQTDGSTCTPNPCPVPLGSCCETSGTCELAAGDACGGSYGGDNTTCTPNPCPQPSGTCCEASGACGFVLQSACSAVWTIGGACTPNPCPQPTGTCCAADGSCTVTAEAGCANVWTLGAACAPLNPCPQRQGSCCAAGGGCTQAVQAECAGVWAMGNVCTPNPCPQPQGVCCSAGVCTFVEQVQCAATWTIGGSCTPNPCPPATVAIQVSRTGNGSGSVSSTPGGILCGAACTASFAVGSMVTLEAVANADSVFVEWSGGPCAGTGTCSFMVSGPETITATFRCKADFDADGTISVQDIFEFLNAWFAGDLRTDVDGSPGITVQDIFGFLNIWFAGC